MRGHLIGFICFTLSCAALAEELRLVLENPGMEVGNEVPEGWRGRFGSVTVTRDTAVFHAGAASLSVQNPTAGSGSAHQMLDVKPGLKLKVGGWIKSSEGAKVNLAAQFFDDKFTWNEFVPIKHLEGEEDWQLGEKEITVPERAARMALSLYVDGIGRGWLDDVTLSAEGAVVVVKTPEPAPKPPNEPDDPKLIPTTPLPGYFAGYPKAWQAYHENNLKRAKQGNVDVLFVGDSITQGWGLAGKETWDKNFAPLNAANFGIGGDKTGNVLWRLDHGAVDGISPKLVVLMIGVNNLWSGRNTGEEIAGGIRAIVEKFRVKLPQAKVLVLGVLPIDPNPDGIGRVKAGEINVHAARLDDGAKVKFLDLGGKLLARDGKLLSGAYLPDHLHLTAKGYEILATDLIPVVLEMLK